MELSDQVSKASEPQFSHLWNEIVEQNVFKSPSNPGFYDLKTEH